MTRTRATRRTSTLADELMDAIALIRRQSRRTVGSVWPITDLSASQFDLLKVVRRSPGISVAEAATDLGLVPNTVSTLVSQLTKMGMLHRAADPTDRRIARLSLTTQANTYVAEWRARRNSAVARALTDLDQQSLAAMDAALPVLREVIASLRAEGGPS